MNNYDKLIKKRNRNLIIFLFVMFASFIPFIPAAILLDKDENSTFGIILVILALTIFAGSFVWIICTSIKLNGKIHIIEIENISKKINNKSGNNVFKTSDGKDIEFDVENFIVDDKSYNLKEYKVVASFEVSKSLIPSITLFKDLESYFVIPIDGDLLDVLNECNIIIENKEELDFYINNLSTANKQIYRRVGFYQSKYIVMEFNKNKKDNKKFINRSVFNIMFFILSLAVIIGINILIIWLGDSKEGIEFSNKIGMDLIVKIVFSIIFILLIFVKSKQYCLLSKTLIGIYLIMYWVGIIFLSGRANSLINFIFMILFLTAGIYELYKGFNDKKYYNRFLGISIFLMLILILSTQDITIIDEGKPCLLAIIPEVILLVVVGTILYLYYKKNNKESKKSKIITISSIMFCTLFLGYCFLYLITINLNYTFDTSTPIIDNYEIIELESGNDDDTDKAIVLINNERIEVSISDEEYYQLKVGDFIEVYHYSGAFEIEYYIHYRE